MASIRLLPLSLAAILAVAPVSAQEAFTWVYNAHFPLDPASAELDLVATQPETVSVAGNRFIPEGLIWAQCVAGFSEGNVILRFEAFAGAAQAGDMVAFQMSDGSGTVLTRAAVIVNADLGDVVGGPEFFVDAEGPELAMLANAPVLTYGVVGLTDFITGFDLTGNQAYVARFIEDCAEATAGGGPGAGGATTAGAAPDVSPAPAALQFGADTTGHVWTRFSQVSDIPSETILDVVYGVPETDDVLVYGSCVPGAAGSHVAITFAADVTGMQNGAEALLRLSIPDGRSAEVAGRVAGIGSEVGLAGIEVMLDVRDRAWLVIAGDTRLRVERVGGLGAHVLTGTGPNTLGTFLADCAGIAGLGPEDGLQPSAPIGAQPGYLACDARARVASRDTGAPQVVNFINASDAYRALVWFDPSGVPVDLAGLNPGQAATFTTDPGHVWMATDGPGNCREMMQPVPGVTDYRLTVGN